MTYLRTILLTLFILCGYSFMFGQECSEIFEITEGQAVNAAGVGTRFQGKVVDDNSLLFIGSTNGLRLSLWKTDGTAPSTSMIIEEANMFGNNWDNYHFIDEGFLFQDEGEWSLVSTGNNEITSLPEFAGIDFEWISESKDGTYYLAGEVAGEIEAIEYTPSSNSSKLLDVVHPDANKMNVYDGEIGVLFYAGVSSLDNETSIYLKDTEELVNIVDYLAMFDYAVDDYNGGSIYGKYLYSSFRNDENQFDHIILNMESGEVVTLDSPIQGTITHIEHDNFIFFIGGNKLIKLDTDQFVATTVFDDVYPFSPAIIFNGDLMMVGSNPSSGLLEIASINTSNDEISYLPGALIGESFFGSKFLEFEGSFYYIARQNSEHVLYKYNFQSQDPVQIDVLSEVTGATVFHALEEVQGNLVSSIRFDFIQHELAFCEGIVDAVAEVEYKQLSVFPSPAIDYIEFSASAIEGRIEKVLITNTVGSTVISKTIDAGGQLDISDLVPGLYYGTLIIGGEYYSFKFVKS